MLRTLTLTTLRTVVIALAATGSLLLSSCGGSGGGSGGGSRDGNGGEGPGVSAGPPILSGTVAIGAPLPGATIVITRWDGTTVQAVADATGRYSIDMPAVSPGTRAIYLVQTAGPANGPGQYPRLYSLATGNRGTVNVTPLTSLLVARLLNERQGASPNLTALRGLATPSDAQLAALQQEVVTYLQSRNVDASGVASFIGAPFNAAAGDPHDDAIERLAQTLVNGETIEGVEEHMLARNHAPATLMEILSIQFDADCKAQGAAEPAFPTGPVRVSLGPNGQIALTGTAVAYSYALQPGDRVRLRNAPFFEDSWEFTLSGVGDQLQVIESDKRNYSFLLRRASSGGSIRCTPPGALGADTPSTLAQVRKLRSAISNASFTCPAGAVFPGIADGANSLSIEDDGVLRVAAGHVLHLPSLGLNMSGEVVDSGGGVLAMRVTGAEFRREFSSGFDSFEIALDATGTVLSAQFGQQRDGAPRINKSCAS
jgi:hypothetical protein